MTCVSLCAKDMRPLSLVHGERFVDVADELMGIDTHYRNIPASDVLPHPTTASQKVAYVPNATRDTMRPTIEAAIKHSHCAVTTDMQTEDFKNVAPLQLLTSLMIT